MLRDFALAVATWPNIVRIVCICEGNRAGTRRAPTKAERQRRRIIFASLRFMWSQRAHDAPDSVQSFLCRTRLLFCTLYHFSIIIVIFGYSSCKKKLLRQN